MLTAGVLIEKYEYAKTIKNKNFTKDTWYNAVLTFKGTSEKKGGVNHANGAWKLYTTGYHPTTSNFKLFTK
jgi:hypothetical protein